METISTLLGELTDEDLDQWAGTRVHKRGQGYIDQAVVAGVDLYLSGEASEQTFHSARENNISFIAAGHHATERYGVQALGDYLARRFALEHLFIDCPNPI